MNAGSDTREVAGSLSTVQQVVQSPVTAAPYGRDPDPSIHFGTDRGVLTKLADTAGKQSGRECCTVAGRVHCYSYSWKDYVELPAGTWFRKLKHLRISGYRNGYCGYKGLPDDFQPDAVAGCWETLEVAAPRVVGCLDDLFVVQLERQVSRSRFTTKYSHSRSGSVIAMCRVLERGPLNDGHYPGSLVARSVNRCDLKLGPEGEILAEYFSGESLPPAIPFERHELLGISSVNMGEVPF